MNLVNNLIVAAATYLPLFLAGPLATAVWQSIGYTCIFLYHLLLASESKATGYTQSVIFACSFAWLAPRTTATPASAALAGSVLLLGTKFWECIPGFVVGGGWDNLAELCRVLWVVVVPVVLWWANATLKDNVAGLGVKTSDPAPAPAPAPAAPTTTTEEAPVLSFSAIKSVEIPDRGPAPCLACDEKNRTIAGLLLKLDDKENDLDIEKGFHEAAKSARNDKQRKIDELWEELRLATLPPLPPSPPSAARAAKKKPSPPVPAPAPAPPKSPTPSPPVSSLPPRSPSPTPAPAPAPAPASDPAPTTSPSPSHSSPSPPPRVPKSEDQKLPSPKKDDGKDDDEDDEKDDKPDKPDTGAGAAIKSLAAPKEESSIAPTSQLPLRPIPRRTATAGPSHTQPSSSPAPQEEGSGSPKPLKPLPSMPGSSAPVVSGTRHAQQPPPGALVATKRTGTPKPILPRPISPVSASAGPSRTQQPSPSTSKEKKPVTPKPFWLRPSSRVPAAAGPSRTQKPSPSSSKGKEPMYPRPLFPRPISPVTATTGPSHSQKPSSPASKGNEPMAPKPLLPRPVSPVSAAAGPSHTQQAASAAPEAESSISPTHLPHTPASSAPAATGTSHTQPSSAAHTEGEPVTLNPVPPRPISPVSAAAGPSNTRQSASATPEQETTSTSTQQKSSTAKKNKKKREKKKQQKLVQSQNKGTATEKHEQDDGDKEDVSATDSQAQDVPPRLVSQNTEETLPEPPTPQPNPVEQGAQEAVPETLTPQANPAGQSSKKIRLKLTRKEEPQAQEARSKEASPQPPTPLSEPIQQTIQENAPQTPATQPNPVVETLQEAAPEPTVPQSPAPPLFTPAQGFENAPAPPPGSNVPDLRQTTLFTPVIPLFRPEAPSFQPALQFTTSQSVGTGDDLDVDMDAEDGDDVSMSGVSAEEQTMFTADPAGSVPFGVVSEAAEREYIPIPMDEDLDAEQPTALYEDMEMGEAPWEAQQGFEPQEYPQFQPEGYSQFQPQGYPQFEPQGYPQVHQPQFPPEFSDLALLQHFNETGEVPQVQPQGYPQVQPQGYPQVQPQGYPQSEPQGYPQGYQQQITPESEGFALLQQVNESGMFPPGYEEPQPAQEQPQSARQQPQPAQGVFIDDFETLMIQAFRHLRLRRPRDPEARERWELFQDEQAPMLNRLTKAQRHEFDNTADTRLLEIAWHVRASDQAGRRFADLLERAFEQFQDEPGVIVPGPWQERQDQLYFNMANFDTVSALNTTDFPVGSLQLSEDRLWTSLFYGSNQEAAILEQERAADEQSDPAISPALQGLDPHAGWDLSWGDSPVGPVLQDPHPQVEGIGSQEANIGSEPSGASTIPGQSTQQQAAPAPSAGTHVLPHQPNIPSRLSHEVTPPDRTPEGSSSASDVEIITEGDHTSGTRLSEEEWHSEYVAEYSNIRIDIPELFDETPDDLLPPEWQPEIEIRRRAVLALREEGKLPPEGWIVNEFRELGVVSNEAALMSSGFDNMVQGEFLQAREQREARREAKAKAIEHASGSSPTTPSLGATSQNTPLSATNIDFNFSGSGAMDMSRYSGSMTRRDQQPTEAEQEEEEQSQEEEETEVEKPQETAPIAGRTILRPKPPSRIKTGGSSASSSGTPTSSNPPTSSNRFTFFGDSTCSSPLFPPPGYNPSAGQEAASASQASASDQPSPSSPMYLPPASNPSARLSAASTSQASASNRPPRPGPLYLASVYNFRPQGTVSTPQPSTQQPHHPGTPAEQRARMDREARKMTKLTKAEIEAMSRDDDDGSEVSEEP